MRRYRLHAVLAITIMFWSVTASAVTLHLRSGEGVYGLTCRAARMRGAPQGRSAKILAAVIAYNGILPGQLSRIPTGTRITVPGRWLSYSYHPSRMTVAMSRSIFDMGDAISKREAKRQLDALRAESASRLQTEKMHTAAVQLELAESRTENADLSGRLAVLQVKYEVLKAKKIPGGFAALMLAIRDFFRLRPFISAAVRSALVFMGLLVLLAAVVLALRRHTYVLLPRVRTIEEWSGRQIRQVTQVKVVCEGCLADGKDIGQATIDWKNISRHNIKHSRPPRNPDDLIIGPLAEHEEMESDAAAVH